ncbi:hypothetical protein CEXT_777571 [Caerostris extrusa]|uniref:Uncharacterized protein n=1 Tax=Caerostris extrusa TaxID=172846 RepID=A0AAV4Y3M4_CAEEX|nr:hypothetical protein CEXT_777571 [Caerostris extrusa]
MTFTQGYTLLTIYGEESASKFHFEIAFTCKAFAAASAMLGIPADASDREKQILLTSRKIVIADGIHMRGVPESPAPFIKLLAGERVCSLEKGVDQK